MRFSCWSSLLLLLVCLPSCAKETSWETNTDSQNAACNPWTHEDFVDNFAKQVAWLEGCLVVTNGENLLETHRTQLTKTGSLYAWDKDRYDLARPIDLGSIDDEDNDNLFFLFYAPPEQGADVETFREDFCKKINPQDLQSCLTTRPRSCSFILAFQPKPKPPNELLARLPTPIQDVRDASGKTCRLLLPPKESTNNNNNNNTNVSSIFVTQGSRPACACNQPPTYQSSYAIPADRVSTETNEYEAITTNQAGTYLVISNQKTKKVFLYERPNPGSAFGDPKRVLTLDQKVWNIRFFRSGKVALFVMDTRIEFWNIAAAIATEGKGKLAVYEVPTGSSAATADAVPLTDTLVAIALNSGGAQDQIHIWRMNDKKIITSLTVPSVQTLALSGANRLLLVGGQHRELNLEARRPYLQAFLFENDTYEKVKSKLDIVLPLSNTSATSLQISPDDRFIALGTGPDFSHWRQAPHAPDPGDHSHVYIWDTNPLKAPGLALEFEGKSKLHSTSLRRVSFSPDGRFLLTMSIGIPKQPNDLLIWQRDENAKPPYSTSNPPFKHYRSMDIGAPIRDIFFGVGCQEIFTTSFSVPNVRAWTDCGFQ